MFCPSCGANNSTEQKFCRSCGMNLEQTALSLLEQFPTAQRANLKKQEQMLERFGQIAFGGFGVVIATAVAAILYLILTKWVLSGVSFWSGILLIAFIIFAGLSLAYVIFAETLKEKKQKLNPMAEPKRLEMPAGPLLRDAEGFVPVVSVTESTTELLQVESKTRKL
jgi:zinc-ribbon domain